MHVALLGSTGILGRLVAAELERRGFHHHPIEDEAEPDADVVVAAVPACAALDDSARAAAGRGGRWVGASGVVAHVRRLHEHLDTAAGGHGARLVPAAGWMHAMGDLLAARAAAGMAGPEEVHVTYLVSGWRSVAGLSTRGMRREIVQGLHGPGLALLHGELADEPAGQARRLAWFPRPVGPHHAAGIPSAEALSVPRHLPGVRTVRSYVAVPTWAAELLQALGNLGRTARGGRWLERRFDGSGVGDVDAWRQERWAVVVEVATRGGDVARAWAYGHDRMQLSATMLVEFAERLVTQGGAPAGVLAPAQVADPVDLLDTLAARTDLRWSVTRPSVG